MSPPLCALGHVSNARQLAAGGWTRARLDAALQSGVVVRLRRGLFACAHLDEATAAAGRLGGALTCVSVLRQSRVWAGNGQRLHIQVPPSSSISAPAAKLHWVVPEFGMESQCRTSALQALWQALHCLDEEHAIASVESAVKEKFISREELAELIHRAPRRLQSGLATIIMNSGSGNETVVRRRLAHVGYRVVPQGHIPGLGHQDLVVEDCVGLEIDSHEWHDSDSQRDNDTTRDLHSEGLGRHVLRIRANHIYASWPQTLAVIDRVVADARLLRGLRLGSASKRAADDRSSGQRRR
jgi:very-short-patch-repair endonuclease